VQFGLKEQEVIDLMRLEMKNHRAECGVNEFRKEKTKHES
jgi:hypothetical protein